MTDEGKSKEFEITVNARPRKVDLSTIDYDQAVELAFGDNPPSGPNIEITVTWRHGNDGGTLIKGGPAVNVQNGMKLNVTPTDKS